MNTMQKESVVTETAASSVSYHDGMRDTIESIIVAFILAFVFRAFVVEAFVIPTGSMAPGLYGAHAQHRCEMCKYSFAFGIRDSVRGPDGQILNNGTLDVRGFPVRCPNCGWYGPGNSDLNDAVPVVPDSGDRILVHKWTYDIGGPILGPRRWDVVVFKDPQDADTNFIKRLLGLPGEVVEIIDGDLYAAPIESLPADIVNALSKPPPTGNLPAARLTPEQDAELMKRYKIQRKTRVAQQSLWMIHYDHDFPPLRNHVPEFPAYSPPFWEGEDAAANKAWSAKTPLVRFAPPDDKQHWLRLSGNPVQDHYGYNDVLLSVQHQPFIDVGDVRVRFTLFPGEGEGSVTLSLQKGSDEFRVRLASDGQVVLDRSDPGAKMKNPSPVRIELARGKCAAFRAEHPVDLEFQNLDYRVTFLVNGEEIVSTSDEQYHPDLPRLRQRPYTDGKDDRATVKIAGEKLPLELRHLVVERDVFYRWVSPDESSLQGRPRTYDRLPGWGTATNPLLLRKSPGEFFCCGDNSPQSLDGRFWWKVAQYLKERGNYHFGTVPEDQMIGHAFFVYWPGGLRISKDTPPIVPNVGKMRIIR